MYMIIQFGVGHVVAGEFERTETQLGITLRSTRAATIRKWETTKGLGELSDGPLKSILDPIPHGVEIPVSSLVGVWRLSANGEKAWSKKLADICPARVLDAF